MAEEARAMAEETLRRAPNGERITLAQFSDDVETLGDLSGYRPRAGADPPGSGDGMGARPVFRPPARPDRTDRADCPSPGI